MPGATPGRVAQPTAVFVAELPLAVTDAELEKFFCRAGVVRSVYRIRDRSSKRFNGCAVARRTASERERLLRVRAFFWRGRSARERPTLFKLSDPLSGHVRLGGGGEDRDRAVWRDVRRQDGAGATRLVSCRDLSKKEKNTLQPHKATLGRSRSAPRSDVSARKSRRSLPGTKRKRFGLVTERSLSLSASPETLLSLSLRLLCGGLKKKISNRRPTADGGGERFDQINNRMLPHAPPEPAH